MQTLPATAPDAQGPARLRLWIRVAALGYTLFVVYGSLVPLKFTPLPWAEAIERFRNLAQLQLGMGTRADWGANLLLFVPLAALWAAAAGPSPARRGGRLARSLRLLAACAVLSVLVEFAQIHFPPRVVSLNDIAAQCLGSALGIALWWNFAPGVERWLAGLPLVRGRSNLAQRALAAYLVLLFAYSLLPLDLTISPVEVYHKWREGRVLLLPFGTHYASGSAAAYDVLSDVVIWVPVAALLRVAAPRTAGGTVLRVAGLAAMLELLQLFVFTRVVDVTDVLSAALGAWIGARLASSIGGAAEVHAATRSPKKPGAHAWRWAVIAVLWLLVLAVVFWFPFNFSTDRSFVLARLNDLARVPFETYQQGSELRAATEVLHKLLFFAPLGVALQRLAVALHAARPPGWVTVLMLLGAIGCALAIEVGQILLPGKVADGTDAALETLGAWLGYLVAGWWSSRWNAPQAREFPRGAPR